MSDDISKIVPLASEMGISHKTIYNWINAGHLKMEKPGFVSKSEAWAVLEFMQAKRVEISFFLSTYAIKRDSNGRFTPDEIC